MNYIWNKVSKEAKIRNRYNQVPHLSQDTTVKHHIQGSQNILGMKCVTLQFFKALQWLYCHLLVDTKAYKLQPSLSERVVVVGHSCHTALLFGVKANENQDIVPTLYWLPKLH